MDPCHAQWVEYIERAWSGDDVRQVLDVCCGSGLMTAELRDRGYAVTGLDASPAMLARARALLGPDVPLLEGVLPALPFELTAPFDAAVSTLDGLNYLTLDDLRATFRALAGVLRPGGWLIFDVHGEAAVGFLLAHPVIEGEEDGTSFTLTTIVDEDLRRCATTIALVADEDGQSFVEEHVQYVHSLGEVRSALEAAGFEVLAVTEEYTDVPATADSLRVTWVARKDG